MIKDISKKDPKELSFKEKLILNLFESVHSIVFGLIVMTLVFTFGFKISAIEGDSMNPTLLDGDRVVLTACNSDFEYGQVIISVQPNGFGEPVVKRIIALENQKVDIDFTTGNVFVDDILLDEPYINNPTVNSEGVSFPLTVPEGHVFVMGDNRQESTDSRSEMIGFIKEEYILGVVKYRLFNVNDGTGEFEWITFQDWKVE